MTDPLQTLALVGLSLFFVAWALLNIRRLVAGYRTARLGGQNQAWLSQVLVPRLYKPISILVPTHNQGPQVQQALQTLLALDYPQFEVVLVNDGSSDDTLSLLEDTFQLVRQPSTARALLPAMQVRGAYRSSLHPNLVVVDKERGGRSDALNAAVNHAHYPLILFCNLDTHLDHTSLLQAATEFINNDRLVALVGNCQLGHVSYSDGHDPHLRLPASLLQRFQILEQARNYLFPPGRWNPKLVSSWSMFGLYLREEVLNVEGLHSGGGAEFELVLRLQKRSYDFGLPFQILYDPRFFCWKEPPKTWLTLLRQRALWQRGVLKALWKYRKLFFKTKYASLVWTLPEAWLYQVAAPVVMSVGYVCLLGLTLLGRSEFLGVYLVFASVFGLLISSLALYTQSVYARGFRRRRSLLVLWLDAFLEPIFYQPILTFSRLGALLGSLRRPRKTGVKLRRTG